MDYIIRHLPKGENVYAKTRKSLFIFLRDILIAVVLAGIAIGIHLGLKVSLDIMVWVYVAIGGIVLLCALQSWVKFISTILVVTTHKFMFKEDLITISLFDTMLQNIDSVEVEYRTPLRRALNVGDITIRTRTVEHVFTNLSKPDKFASILNKRSSDIQDGAMSLGKMNISFGVTAGNKSPYIEG